MSVTKKLFLFSFTETASRICLLNGTWFSHPGLNGSNSGWTNFTSCLTQTSLHVTKHPEIDLGVAKIVLVGEVRFTFCFINLNIENVFCLKSELHQLVYSMQLMQCRQKF